MLFGAVVLKNRTPPFGKGGARFRKRKRGYLAYSYKVGNCDAGCGLLGVSNIYPECVGPWCQCAERQVKFSSEGYGVGVGRVYKVGAYSTVFCGCGGRYRPIIKVYTVHEAWAVARSVPRIGYGPGFGLGEGAAKSGLYGLGRGERAILVIQSQAGDFYGRECLFQFFFDKLIVFGAREKDKSR